MIKYLEIDENSRLPKYQQIVDSFVCNISNGNILVDQKIPSISALSEEFLVSRDTVSKAYNILKKRKIIKSFPRQGSYIDKVNLTYKFKVLFLINKLSPYKMRVYNAFVNRIGLNSNIDLQIYHCDEFLFLNSLKVFDYDYYVIMPHFKTKDQKYVSITEPVRQVLEKIPNNKLVFLDNLIFPKDENITSIYQDYEYDIYNALKAGLEKIVKYNKVILIFNENSVNPYPKRILKGFIKFCVEFDVDFEIYDAICEDMILKNGDLFITIEESDLISLIQQVRDASYILGTDIGVVSYNDTPLKELFGITVMSADFEFMGEMAADAIINNERGVLKVPFSLIDRNSM